MTAGASNETLLEMIARTYSPEEAERFRRYDLTDFDRQTLIDAGRFVLETVPWSRSANACAHMSALWAAAVRDNSQVPVHAVSGNLSINGRRIYHSDESPAALRAAFSQSSLAYDGHFWIAVPGGVGEVALFRSAYSQPEGHWLRTLVTEEFGPKRGLLFGPVAPNMSYTPKFVLTDTEITSLIKAMMEFLVA
jgi:hypothetical protein